MKATDFSKGDRLLLTSPAPAHPAPGCSKSCCVPQPEAATVKTVFAKRDKLSVVMDSGSGCTLRPETFLAAGGTLERM